MLSIELDEQGRIIRIKGKCKAGNVKKYGLIKASTLEVS